MKQPVDGVLLDIDGVLAVSWEPIAGAAETIEWLRGRGLPFRLVTNTSSQSRRNMASTLVDAGIGVEPEEIITAVAATASYLRSHHPGASVFLLSDEGSIEDLDGIELVDRDAGVVVIGGASEQFSYDNLNRAFKLVMGGAPLVAMHRSLYWKTTEGLELDGGAYTRALEEATGVEAVVCGKPAGAFFEAAVEAVGEPASRVVMVGDDIATDVLAAQDLGMTGVLVQTGKFRPGDLERGTPDHLIDSIADLPNLLDAS
jgi:HAD superfamily hydrolase (TIGR01458 family)